MLSAISEANVTMVSVPQPPHPGAGCRCGFVPGYQAWSGGRRDSLFSGFSPSLRQAPRAGVLERALLRSCFSSLGQPRSGLDPGWSWVGVSCPAHLGSRPSLAISVDPGSIRRSAPSLGVERLFLRLPLSAAMGVCLCPGNKKATYLSPKADAVFLIFLSQQRSFT